VVSKRIAKQAVERNRLKRLLGEAVRGYLPDILPGMDIVISARNAAGAAPLSTLTNEIRILLQRAKLLAVAPRTTNRIP
jgi:ribonuclease P protein component